MKKVKENGAFEQVLMINDQFMLKSQEKCHYDRIKKPLVRS